MFLILNCLLFVFLQNICGKEIIIIGSGAAGIAAATRFLEQNVTSIRILEAENRIGGRVYTKPFSDNVIDIGAQWCQGQQGNVVYDLAYPLGLLEEAKNDLPSESKIADINANILDKNITYNAIQIITHLMVAELDNIKDSKEPLGKYLTRVFYAKFDENPELKNISDEYKLNFLRLLEKYILSGDATDTWFDLSVEGEQDSISIEGSNFLWRRKGFKTILDVLMKKLPNPNEQLPIDDKILLNKEVVSIKWDNSDNKVVTECADGSKYTSDVVLLTMSVGVLKHDMATLFTPKLPPFKENAIQGIGLGQVAKIIMEFKTPWWIENSIYLHFFWPEKNKNNFYEKFNKDDEWMLDVCLIHSVEYLPRVLMGWVVGKSVEKMELLSETQVQSQIMKLIRTFYGNSFNITDPTKFLRSTWKTNPHFRGTYSFHGYDMYKFNTTTHDLAEPVMNSNNKAVLYFAGEATNKHRFGMVNGAIETGWREADRILKI